MNREERKFTTASQLTVDMQIILREDPDAVVEMEKDRKRIRFIFRCGDSIWFVPKSTAQSITWDDFRLLFKAPEFVVDLLNKRVCLKRVGLNKCGCGRDDLHAVYDVMDS